MLRNAEQRVETARLYVDSTAGDAPEKARLALDQAQSLISESEEALRTLAPSPALNPGDPRHPGFPYSRRHAPDVDESG